MPRTRSRASCRRADTWRACAGRTGVRVDAGVSEGDVVGDRYDPMLAKIIAHGSTRRDALDRLRTALGATTVLGVRTNLRFLRWLAEHPRCATARCGPTRSRSWSCPARPTCSTRTGWPPHRC